mmetsp:Transcript_24148/g.60297  ORF Transcript_24148/g.60297 Transcript_24148/m.60297 type:complete len:280 (+) Transcript_24148:515-1354(+)
MDSLMPRTASSTLRVSALSWSLRVMLVNSSWRSAVSAFLSTDFCKELNSSLIDALNDAAAPCTLLSTESEDGFSFKHNIIKLIFCSKFFLISATGPSGSSQESALTAAFAFFPSFSSMLFICCSTCSASTLSSKAFHTKSSFSTRARCTDSEAFFALRSMSSELAFCFKLKLKRLSSCSKFCSIPAARDSTSARLGFALIELRRSCISPSISAASALCSKFAFMLVISSWMRSASAFPSKDFWTLASSALNSSCNNFLASWIRSSTSSRLALSLKQVMT